MRLTDVHERVLIILIALHSIIIGIMLLVFPEWAVLFAGWQGAEPVFFIRQAGVFHFALAAGYLVEYFRWRSISLLLIAKTIAFVFLIGGWFLADVPWSVWFSGLADGGMAIVAYLVHRAVMRNSTG